MTRTKLLAIVLRVVGVMSLFALVAVVMPMSWMAAIHAWLGLGDMPQGAIVEYLARSLSIFYALFGALCLVLATDVDRYRKVVWFLGWCVAVLGVVLIGIDVSADMPVSWTASEGPTAVVFGILLIVLARADSKNAAPSDRST